MIRRERPADPGEVRAAITRGAALCLAGGVVAVGDILGAPRGRPMIDGFPALADSPLHGVGFVEFFGIGARAPASVAALPDLIDSLAGLASERVRPGLQPHAPNTVSLPVYLAAAGHAMPRGLTLATHLAETLEERRFVSDAAGPQRELLESLGIWDDAELAQVGRGKHPVEHLHPFLDLAPVLAAHLNDCPDHALAILRQTPTSVAYCPRASAYFGAPERLGPHRYREMLAAGVNVCLGTDSLVNLDTPDRISVLDEARLLYRRDATPPGLIMAMATRHGARALGLDECAFSLGNGATPAGVVAVRAALKHGDVGGAVLGGTGDPEVLFLRTDSCFVGHNLGKSNA
jgi:cytosine/adenosine deaminase-related metal-dependent hydrolase